MKKCISCGFSFDMSGWKCPQCAFEPPGVKSIPLFAPELQFTDSGFDSVFFDNLAGLEGRSFWFRSRNKLLLWAFAKYFPNATSYLEIGCGTGFVLSAFEQTFPSVRVAGSEVHVNGLKHAAQRAYRANLYQLDARCLPFDNEFDVIGAYDVLEHIIEDESVIAEMHRALKPGGGIMVTVPQHPFLWSAADDYAHHQRRYTRRELLAKLQMAGFRLTRCTSFVSLLLPSMLCSRVIRRSSGAHYNPNAEFEISPMLDAILQRIMNLEIWMIRSGISFRAGGSLLAVMQKR